MQAETFSFAGAPANSLTTGHGIVIKYRGWAILLPGKSAWDMLIGGGPEETGAFGRDGMRAELPYNGG
jgi:hypothetical protein